MWPLVLACGITRFEQELCEALLVSVGLLAVCYIAYHSLSCLSIALAIGFPYTSVPALRDFIREMLRTLMAENQLLGFKGVWCLLR